MSGVEHEHSWLAFWSVFGGIPALTLIWVLLAVWLYPWVLRKWFPDRAEARLVRMAKSYVRSADRKRQNRAADYERAREADRYWRSIAERGSP